MLEGIDVVTSSEKILRNRRMVLELLMARVPGSPQLEALGAEYGAKTGRFKPSDKECILCGLCVSVCRDVVGVDALGFMGRGAFKDVRPPFGEPSKDCIGCAACVMACPVDCIKMEESPTRRRIVRWGRDLPMKVCESCGYPFAPTFQLLHFTKLIGTKLGDYTLCQDCRK